MSSLPSLPVSNQILKAIVTTQLKRDIVPYMAFTSFRDSYEEPMEEEGFSEIRRVHWVFEGSEQERDMWKMWLQIDGK